MIKKSLNIGAKSPEMAQNFKNSYLGLGMNFLDFFRDQNYGLVVGYLMGTEIFEFWPNLCLWQLFKEANRRGILTNFAKGARKLHQTLRLHILG